jgi:hypothetical protein
MYPIKEFLSDEQLKRIPALVKFFMDLEILYDEDGIGENENPNWDGTPYHKCPKHHYRITFQRSETNPYLDRPITQTFVTYYSCPEGVDVTSVLECLQSDVLSANDDFGDFCREFGFEDPNRSMKAWNGCNDTKNSLKKFLGDDKFKEFMATDPNKFYYPEEESAA